MLLEDVHADLFALLDEALDELRHRRFVASIRVLPDSLRVERTDEAAPCDPQRLVCRAWDTDSSEALDHVGQVPRPALLDLQRFHVLGEGAEPVQCVEVLSLHLEKQLGDVERRFVDCADQSF